MCPAEICADELEPTQDLTCGQLICIDLSTNTDLIYSCVRKKNSTMLFLLRRLHHAVRTHITQTPLPQHPRSDAALDAKQTVVTVKAVVMTIMIWILRLLLFRTCCLHQLPPTSATSSVPARSLRCFARHGLPALSCFIPILYLMLRSTRPM